MHKMMWGSFSLDTWFHSSTHQRLQTNAAFVNQTVTILLKKDDGTGLRGRNKCPVRPAESWDWSNDATIINVGIIINTHFIVETELHLPISCILTWITHQSLLALTWILLEIIIGIGLQVRSLQPAESHFVFTVTYCYFYLKEKKIKLSRPEATSQFRTSASFGISAPASPFPVETFLFVNAPNLQRVENSGDTWLYQHHQVS